MYRLWIVLLAFCAIFTVAGVADIAGTPAAAAQEAASPQEVVDGFYAWYLAYLTPDAQGNFANPLVDRAYRGSPFLTADLIASLDRLVAAGDLRADPLLCAQDLPGGVNADLIRADEETALVALRQYYSGMASPRTIAVALVQEDGAWCIDEVRCELAADEVVALVYGQYAEHARRAIDREAPTDPMENLLISWRIYLADALLAELAAKAGEPRLADPILCAQDIPAAFTVEAVEDGAYRVSGLFPAGPETLTAYPLARVQVETGPTGWRITAIRCEAR